MMQELLTLSASLGRDVFFLAAWGGAGFVVLGVVGYIVGYRAGRREGKRR